MSSFDANTTYIFNFVNKCLLKINFNIRLISYIYKLLQLRALIYGLEYKFNFYGNSCKINEACVWVRINALGLVRAEAFIDDNFFSYF